jgi:hypothetical protein
MKPSAQRCLLNMRRIYKSVGVKGLGEDVFELWEFEDLR